MTPLSAGDRLSRIPELLELVLLELSRLYDHQYRARGLSYDDLDEYLKERRILLRTILRSQRVSRAFHETITGSPALRQTLFFSPTSLEHNDGAHPVYDMNPLLYVYWRNLRLGALRTSTASKDDCKLGICRLLLHQIHTKDIAKKKDDASKSQSWRRMYFSWNSLTLKCHVRDLGYEIEFERKARGPRNSWTAGKFSRLLVDLRDD